MKAVLILLFVVFSATLLAAPVVTSIAPSYGGVAGGNNITILGSGFTGVTDVDFGFRAATGFTFVNDEEITATVPPGTAGSFHTIVKTPSGTSPVSRNDLYTYTQDAWQGIISGINTDQISLFNTSTNSFTSPIALLADSSASVITPDGTRIYAPCADGTVQVIDVATHTIVVSISTTEGLGSFDIIASPDGTRVYISNFTTGKVTAIDTLTNMQIPSFYVAPQLGALSITPNGKTVYVGSFANSTVTPVDTATFAVGTAIPTGISPGMISITPDGTKAYVSNLNSDWVSVIDTDSNTVVGTINSPMGAGPYGSSLLANGKTLYVVNNYSSTVSLIDVATNILNPTKIDLAPNSLPFWAAATPDSKTVYVIYQGINDVTPIDVATNTAGTSFGNLPVSLQDIVMSPDPAPVASFVANPLPVGFPTSFDASASISPIGTITTYDWDFGDSTTAVTATPTINHTYTSSGIFNTTLKVTNSAGTSTEKVFSSRFMSNNGGELATLMLPVNIASSSPTKVKGFQRKCVTKLATTLVNVITWAPPSISEQPISYKIYANPSLTRLLATVGEFVFKYEQCKRKKGVTYTYYLVAVYAGGYHSAPVTVVIP